MIPAVIDPSVCPPGEVELFGRFQRDAPPDWIVLHSLDIPRHVRQLEGELDFLVLVPGVAAICIEVKSHQRVVRDSVGLWRLGNDAPTERSPFRQAAEGMHSTRKRLQKFDGLFGVPFTSVVAFPRCKFDVAATEWEPWQVFDESQMNARGITDVVNRIGRSLRQKLAGSSTAGWFVDAAAQPTSEQCELIVSALRPTFERSRSPKARRAEAEGEIRKYTAEQFRALDWLDSNQRIVFSGAAGTGKTFIAIEAARRAALAGERVLLCCYNRLLGSWLKREATPLGDLVTTGTLHSIMRNIADVSIDRDVSPQYWATELPNLAADALLDGHPDFMAYDLVVIDEAQDICTGEYLDVLDLLVKGGLDKGRLLAFGDFEYQSIYTGEDGHQLLRERFSAASFKLSENCRNRPRIGYVATAAFGRDPYHEYRRADDGIEVTIRTYPDAAAQTGVLQDLIDEVRSDGYQLGDIAILAPVARGAAWERMGGSYRAWCIDAGQDGSAKIRTSTVHSFKGLEASAIIVTDLNEISSEQARQLLYVATTRATDRLSICVHEAATSQLAQLLIGAIDDHSE